MTVRRGGRASFRKRRQGGDGRVGRPGRDAGGRCARDRYWRSHR